MGIIIRPNTYTTGNIIYASKHNENEETLYNEINGRLDDANIKTSAGIVESKVAFDVVNGHNHNGVNSAIVSTQSYVAMRNKIWEASFDLSSGTQTYLTFSVADVIVNGSGSVGTDFSINLNGVLYTLKVPTISVTCTTTSMNYVYCYYDSGTDDLLLGVTQNKPYYGISHPSGPIDGDLFYSYITSSMYKYNGTTGVWDSIKAQMIFYGYLDTDWTTGTSWYYVLNPREDWVDSDFRISNRNKLEYYEIQPTLIDSLHSLYDADAYPPGAPDKPLVWVTGIDANVNKIKSDYFKTIQFNTLSEINNICKNPKTVYLKYDYTVACGLASPDFIPYTLVEYYLKKTGDTFDLSTIISSASGSKSTATTASSVSLDKSVASNSGIVKINLDNSYECNSKLSVYGLLPDGDALLTNAIAIDLDLYLVGVEF